MAKAKKKEDVIATAEKTRKFLDALIESGGNITEACRVAELDRSAVYRMESGNPEFAEEFRAAQRHGLAVLEDEARRRAFSGTNKPVFYQGTQCGAVREYSDTLMIFLLKGGMPEKYKERLSAEHSGPDGAPIALEHGATPEVAEFLSKLRGASDG